MTLSLWLFYPPDVSSSCDDDRGRGCGEEILGNFSIEGEGGLINFGVEWEGV